MNAFEDGHTLVLDVATYPDPGVIDALYLEALRARGRVPGGELPRFRMPTAGGAVVSDTVCPVPLELPRIDDDRDGRTYRFVYGTGKREPDDPWFDQLVNVDVASGSVTTWHETGCYPGEPVFVAGPGRVAGEEDRGVLLSVVLDARAHTSFLLVLDVGSLRELARARAPHAIPLSFHGDYVRHA